MVDGQTERYIKALEKFIELYGYSSYKCLQNIYSNHNEKDQAVSLAIALTERLIAGHGVCRVHGGGSCHVLKVRKYGEKNVV